MLLSVLYVNDISMYMLKKHMKIISLVVIYSLILVTPDPSDRLPHRADVHPILSIRGKVYVRVQISRNRSIKRFTVCNIYLSICSS